MSDTGYFCILLCYQLRPNYELLQLTGIYQDGPQVRSMCNVFRFRVKSLPRPVAGFGRSGESNVECVIATKMKLLWPVVDFLVSLFIKNRQICTIQETHLENLRGGPNPPPPPAAFMLQSHLNHWDKPLATADTNLPNNLTQITYHCSPQIRPPPSITSAPATRSFTAWISTLIVTSVNVDSTQKSKPIEWIIACFIAV